MAAAIRMKAQILNNCVIFWNVFVGHNDSAIMIHLSNIILCICQRVLAVKVVLQDVFELESVGFAHAGVAAELNLTAAIDLAATVAF